MDRLLGTSAGAISAVLVAAGFTVKELLEIARTEGTKDAAFPRFLEPPDFDSLREAARRPDSETRRLFRQAIEKGIDQALQTALGKAPRLALGLKAGLGMIPQRDDIYDAALNAILDHAGQHKNNRLAPLLSFLEFGGFFSTEVFEAWLGGLLKRKFRDYEPTWTLAEFAQRSGRDFSACVADTSDKQPLILNHRTAPDCPVLQAVRMSMSIPLVWQEVVWQAGWGKYLGEVKTGHFIVDGAAVLTLPILYFAEPRNERVIRVMGPPRNDGALPLGLLLDDQLPVPGDVEPPRLDASKVTLRIGRLIDTVTRWGDEAVRVWDQVICRIPTFGYSALEFGISQERIEVLLNGARDAMLAHLRARKLA